MDWDLILWLIALLSNIALLVLLIYQIICLSDLEADYMNPYESSANINRVVIPEFILEGTFCVLFLFTGHWFMFFITFPICCYHVRLFMKREHLVDVTEIFRALGNEKKFRIIKLALYLFFFFLVIVRLVIALYNSLADEDEAVHGFWVF
ncbi:hypothetical protein Ancab_013782 [Ancistrocladus abbreviatus]